MYLETQTRRGGCGGRQRQILEQHICQSRNAKNCCNPHMLGETREDSSLELPGECGPADAFTTNLSLGNAEGRDFC